MISNKIPGEINGRMFTSGDITALECREVLPLNRYVKNINSDEKIIQILGDE